MLLSLCLAWIRRPVRIIGTKMNKPLSNKSSKDLLLWKWRVNKYCTGNKTKNPSVYAAVHTYAIHCTSMCLHFVRFNVSSGVSINMLLIGGLLGGTTNLCQGRGRGPWQRGACQGRKRPLRPRRDIAGWRECCEGWEPSTDTWKPSASEKSVQWVQFGRTGKVGMPSNLQIIHH